MDTSQMKNPGTRKASTREPSRMMALFGLTLPSNSGSSMSFPLSAVAARAMLFSSRFWSKSM